MFQEEKAQHMKFMAVWSQTVVVFVASVYAWGVSVALAALVVLFVSAGDKLFPQFLVYVCVRGLVGSVVTLSGPRHVRFLR